MEIGCLRDGKEEKVRLRKNENYAFSIEEFERGFREKVLEQRALEGRNGDISIAVLEYPSEIEKHLMNPNNNVTSMHNTCADNWRTLCVHFSDEKGGEHRIALYGYQKVYNIR